MLESKVVAALRELVHKGETCQVTDEEERLIFELAAFQAGRISMQRQMRRM